MVVYFIVKLDSNVVERFSYDIFGKRRNVNGSDDAGTITAGNNIKGASPRRGYTGHEMLDNLSLVHMNGRVYDPGLGRVLSADPIIQAPYMTQSYNRYTYVMNNPLALTDPSGYNWLTKGLRGLIFGVTSLIPAIGNRLDNFFANSKFGQFALSSILTFYGGSPGAALASAYLTAVQGGSESDIFMAGLKTGATAFAFELAGGVGGGGEAGANSFGRYAAHAGAGCLSGYANGEGCGRGAASAVAGKFMTNGMDAAGFDKAQMFVGTVVAGGVTSALGGGKFANGAQTAAFGYLLNQLGSRKNPAEAIAADALTDGRLSLGEANAIWRANNDPNFEVSVDASQLSVQQLRDFGPNGTAPGTVQGADWFVHGSVTLRQDALGSISILPGAYDFELHGSLTDHLTRNLLTYGGFYLGSRAGTSVGIDYLIKYNGNPNVFRKGD
jgi:RHS repeat-associated protein